MVPAGQAMASLFSAAVALLRRRRWSLDPVASGQGPGVSCLHGSGPGRSGTVPDHALPAPEDAIVQSFRRDGRTGVDMGRLMRPVLRYGKSSGAATAPRHPGSPSGHR